MIRHDWYKIIPGRKFRYDKNLTLLQYAHSNEYDNYKRKYIINTGTVYSTWWAD